MDITNAHLAGLDAAPLADLPGDLLDRVEARIVPPAVVTVRGPAFGSAI